MKKMALCYADFIAGAWKLSRAVDLYKNVPYM